MKFLTVCVEATKHCKKLIDVLVRSLRAMFLALTKVRKRDFCIVLAGKQQKYRNVTELKITITQNIDKHTTLNLSLSVSPSNPFLDT